MLDSSSTIRIFVTALDPAGDTARTLSQLPKNVQQAAAVD
jgi:hypothetical protein